MTIPAPRTLPRDTYGHCPRPKTVKALADRLDKHRVVVVRGTPSSGKTTLAHLLKSYYGERGDPVVSTMLWKDVKDPVQHLIRCAESSGYHELTYPYFTDYNVVFLLDDAACTYKDLDLWRGLLKTQSGRTTGPRFCLFTYFGDPITAKPYYPPGEMPLQLKPEQRVSLTTHDAHLYFTPAEFAEDVDRMCSLRDNVPLDEEAREYLFGLTSGHPAAVSALAMAVNEMHHAAIKNNGISTITKDLFIRALDDDEEMFNKLLGYSVKQDILQYGSVPLDLDNPGVSVCFERGWIHADEISPGGEVVCALPSRLHEKYVEFYLSANNPKAHPNNTRPIYPFVEIGYLGTKRSNPFPIDTYPTLPVFCEALLRNFSRSRLHANKGRRIGANVQFREPIEQFRDEFYRVFNLLLGPGQRTSREWPKPGTHRVDFRIVEPGWAIEVFLDGEGEELDERCGRFACGRAYDQMIADGWIKDWIILDFQHCFPDSYDGEKIPTDKLWRVVFNREYSSACVVDGTSEFVVPQFALLD